MKFSEIFFDSTVCDPKASIPGRFQKIRFTFWKLLCILYGMKLSVNFRFANWCGSTQPFPRGEGAPKGRKRNAGGNLKVSAAHQTCSCVGCKMGSENRSWQVQHCYVAARIPLPSFAAAPSGGVDKIHLPPPGKGLPVRRSTSRNLRNTKRCTYDRFIQDP